MAGLWGVRHEAEALGKRWPETQASARQLTVLCWPELSRLLAALMSSLSFGFGDESRSVSAAGSTCDSLGSQPWDEDGGIRATDP